MDIPPEPKIEQEDEAIIKAAEEKAKKEALEKEKERAKEKEQEKAKKSNKRKNKNKDKDEDDDKPIVSNKPVKRSMRERIREILGK